MNKYSSIYQSISDLDLLRIIENPEQYEPEAQIAAKEEINNRKWTEEKVNAIKTQLNSEQKTLNTKADKQAKVDHFISSYLNHMNPIEKSISINERLIRIINVVIGLITIYGTINFFKYGAYNCWNYTDAKKIIPDSSYNIPVHIYVVLQTLSPPILLVSAFITFSLRKKLGWILLSSFLNYYIILMYVVLWFLDLDIRLMLSVEDMFPINSQVITTIKLIAPVIFLATLLMKDIRAVFEVDQKTAIKTLLFSLSITCLFYLQ